MLPHTKKWFACAGGAAVIALAVICAGTDESYPTNSATMPAPPRGTPDTSTQVHDSSQTSATSAVPPR